ncbi:Hypothetical protein DPCES_3452 [Desulfitobacterium hafniense]|uniref:Uncharacterized protein n=1 Tax=Desulfitobacterium hafniense TaxID=49338 RepID=A0A098B393_DESHA|nr:hypothetical protein [Desulfitobacterium hafniense]CDX03338.1 Hypothetical protein DPCES_3452 [Desulfitobacterium hafniense]
MDFTEEQQQYIDNLIAETKTKWETEVLAPIQSQVKELEKFKPAEKSDKEKEIEAKEKELFDREKSLILRDRGLRDFEDFFVVSDLKELDKQIEKFNKILEAKKLNNSYVPEGHKATDAYTHAKQNKDTLGMVKALFNK